MEISTGKSTKVSKASLLDQLNSIADKNSHEYRSKVRQLEVTLGVKEVNIFGTANRKIFEENIDDMSQLQLQGFARKMKIDGSGTMAALKTRLLRQFDTQNVQSRGYFSPQPEQKELFSKEQKEKLTKILNG